MRRLAPILVAILALAGCGGHSPTAHPAAVVYAHACNPFDDTVNCPLPAAPVGVTPRSVTATQARGLDFGWSEISGAYCRAHGFRFGASYLSLDPSKNWTAANVRGFHSNGCATVAVLENAADEATAGYAAGVVDARLASSQLASLGDRGGHVDFAIDCDCAPAGLLRYFQGADHILGTRRVGAYGGYYQLQYLCAARVITVSWQTYAWSDGRWLPGSCAPLEQYLNGSLFDYDRAIGAYYGQWPYTAPKRKPNLSIYPQRPVRLYGREVSERGTVASWWTHGCENPVRRQACRTDRRHLGWLAGRLVTLARQRHDRRCIDVSSCGPDIWSDAPYRWRERHWRIERILDGHARRA